MNLARVNAAASGDETAHHLTEGMLCAWPSADASGLDPAGTGLDDPGDLGDSGAEPIRTAATGGAPCADPRQLAEWIDAIVDQDERALAALYDATFTRVFGLVRRIVRSTALAEEVVEDTYFQVWRQAVRFDPARGQALTWLLAIARSRAIDAVRSEARFRDDSIDEHAAIDTAATEADASDALLDLTRHRADLHEALMRLGAQPRQLVSLAFFRGLSHEEIAQQTCMPLGTVKSQIRRALLSLREILGQAVPAALAS
jgi:RNA polymerase sigma-70 factor (ECF subfamily)